MTNIINRFKLKIQEWYIKELNGSDLKPIKIHFFSLMDFLSFKNLNVNINAFLIDNI